MIAHKKGDIIVCPNGHEICELSDDLHVGEMNWARKFVNWRQPEPEVGTIMPITCAICGSDISFDVGPTD